MCANRRVWERPEHFVIPKLAARLRGSDEYVTMSKFGSELIKSMRQAMAHTRGRTARRLRITNVKIVPKKSNLNATD
jgi:hypothetical protein